MLTRTTLALLLLFLPMTNVQTPQPDAALLERARALHTQVPLIDGHNDYPWALRENARQDLEKLDISKPQPSIMTDIARLRAGGVGGEDGGRWFGGLDRQLRALAISPFVAQRLRGLLAKQRKRDLEWLCDQIEAGRVTPILDKAYPLNEASAAMRYLEEGHLRGKVVLVV